MVFSVWINAPHSLLATVAAAPPRRRSSSCLRAFVVQKTPHQDTKAQRKPKSEDYSIEPRRNANRREHTHPWHPSHPW